jgi:hypothetical protein
VNTHRQTIFRTPDLTLACRWHRNIAVARALARKADSVRRSLRAIVHATIRSIKWHETIFRTFNISNGQRFDRFSSNTLLTNLLRRPSILARKLTKALQSQPPNIDMFIGSLLPLAFFIWLFRRSEPRELDLVSIRQQPNRGVLRFVEYLSKPDVLPFCRKETRK